MSIPCQEVPVPMVRAPPNEVLDHVAMFPDPGRTPPVQLAVAVRSVPVAAFVIDWACSEGASERAAAARASAVEIRLGVGKDMGTEEALGFGGRIARL